MKKKNDVFLLASLIVEWSLHIKRRYLKVAVYEMTSYTRSWLVDQSGTAEQTLDTQLSALSKYRVFMFKSIVWWIQLQYRVRILIMINWQPAPIGIMMEFNG